MRERDPILSDSGSRLRGESDHEQQGGDMAVKLTGDTRKTALASIPGWTEQMERDAIFRKFVFKRFQRGLLAS